MSAPTEREAASSKHRESDAVRAEVQERPPYKSPRDEGSDLVWVAVLLLLAASAAVAWLYLKRREQWPEGSMSRKRSARSGTAKLQLSSVGAGKHGGYAAHSAAKEAHPKARSSSEAGWPRANGGPVPSSTTEHPGSADHRRTASMMYADEQDWHSPAAPPRSAGREPHRLDAQREAPAAQHDPEPDLGEIHAVVNAIWHHQSLCFQELNERLATIETHIERLSSPHIAERRSSAGAATPSPARARAPSSNQEPLEDRLLSLWNEIDWERGTPSLSPIERLLGNEHYDLVEGIVGIYALAVPRGSGDDRHSPVYILPILKKANTLYDDSLFERPQDGDSVRLRAAAKVQFAGGASRTSSLARLKAGNERLSQVFEVIAPGRIE